MGLYSHLAEENVWFYIFVSGRKRIQGIQMIGPHNLNTWPIANPWKKTTILKTMY